MKLVICSSLPPDVLQHLLWRLHLDAPEVTVSGVLYETPRRPSPTAGRAPRALRLVRGGGSVGSAVHRAVAGAEASAVRALDAVLRFIHAAPRDPNGPPLTLDALVSAWSARGIAFHVTGDIHAPESLAFLRRLAPDLGLVHGMRTLAPHLLTIPRHGSIAFHEHRRPDGRGGGASGPREPHGGGTEQTVAIHRVIQEADAGPVLGERSLPLEPFDTPESVRLKADLIAVDLLVDVLRAEALGEAVGPPRGTGGAPGKGLQPDRRDGAPRRALGPRRRWHPAYTRSRPKRIARALLLPLLAVRNHARRRRGRFPVIVLYHHLTSDRPKRMGLPTAEFARHVRYLKKHYRIASLPDAARLLEHGGASVPTVVLTLDDGYADNFVGLRAIAEIERVPMTICVCTEHVTARSELAHDVDRGERGFPSMGWDEVRYLDRHGVTIASHTRTHFDCGTTDYAALAREIGDSKRELEHELGHPVDAFAFPKGKPRNISPLACGLALRHYRIVMSAAGGPNTGPMALPAEIRRYSHPDSLLELEMQLQSILDRPVPPRPVAGDAALIPAVAGGSKS